MSTEGNLSMFEELFNESPVIKYPKTWEVVDWKVVKVEKKNILINVNNQFTWIVVSKELGNSVDVNSLKEWDAIDVMVLWDSVSKSLLILSLKRANQIKSLSNLTSNFDTGEVITVRPTEANKWGLLVDIDGLKWFIPVSQLTPLHYPRVEWADAGKILEHLEGLIAKEFKVRVINVDEGGKKIIFSEKAAIAENREKALEKLKVGDIVEWVVSGILTYGLFVTFEGLEWLVHVSEIDWGHVSNPEKFAKVGQKIKVKIIGLDSEKISLSIKRLQENPWDVLAKKYKVGDVVKAPVSRISQFWAFLDLDAWIQWLIHLSEISHWVVKDIRDFVKVWEEAEAKIINFDPKSKRIGLSLKALTKAPEKTSEKVKGTSSKTDDKKEVKEKKSPKKEEAKSQEK